LHFGRKKRDRDQNRKELTNQAFEYLAYEVTKRVQQNQESEHYMNKKLKKFIKENNEQQGKKEILVKEKKAKPKANLTIDAL